MRGSIVELTKQGCCSETQIKLWESLFSNPADWLDYRQSKRSSAYPDFRHRSTKQPLWLNSAHKPAWVDSTLIRYKLDASLLAHLSQCGSLECALHTLLALPSLQGVLSWRSIFSGFVGHGRCYEALRMHSYMRESGFEPDRYVFVSLLKACASRKDCEEGRKLHSESVERWWLALDVYMGSSLVSMYGKCGHVAESERVFCDLPSRNVVTWNTMLSVYVEHGHGVRALLLYRQMQEEGEKPNYLTYVAMLQACSILSLDGCDQHMLVHGEEEEEACLCIGRAMHSDARKQSLDSHPHVGNTLMAMYGKFGKLGEAENVFSALPHSDAITCNVILLAHVEHGRAQDALKLHKLMFEEGVSPDAHTFAISLQACSNLVDEEDAATDMRAVAGDIGLALHADVERKGFEEDSVIVSALVSLYGKCGMVEEAETVFRESANVDDVVAWSTVLSAYVENGLGRKALLAYRQMQEEGVEIDEHALVVALQACGTLLQTQECIMNAQEEFLTLTTAGDIGHALHGDARRKGYTFHPHVHNSLISMYGKCGKLMEAQQVFCCEFPPRNVVSWNVMLSAFVEQGEIVEALQLYKHVLLENVVPDDLMYLIMFQACGRFAEKDGVMVEGKPVKSAALLEIGEALHIDALRSGLILGAFVYNTLVNMYIKNGSLKEALKVLDDSPHHDCFPWNTVLSAFVEQGPAKEALQVYEKMHKNRIPFSPSSIVSCLQACGESSCLQICRQLHAGIVSAGDEASLTVANTLIHAYGSCGSMEDGQGAFNVLLCPDLVSWNAYISGHARQGKSSQCCLEKMRETGIDPNRVTFLSLISACSHGGDIHRGLEYLECMHWDHSMNPDRNHLAAIVDLLGRAGSFKHVEDLLGTIRARADLSIWLRLLGPCYTHSNAELGRWAFDHAVQSHPDRTTLYVWMSNIYAAIAATDGE